MGGPSGYRHVVGRVDHPAVPSWTWPVLVAASLGLGGCLSGSLATNTGPTGPHGWCTAKEQQAHVGETVGYSFILKHPFHKRPIAPYGYADYCVATIGRERVECEVDPGGASASNIASPQSALGNRSRSRPRPTGNTGSATS